VRLVRLGRGRQGRRRRWPEGEEDRGKEEEQKDRDSREQLDSRVAGADGTGGTGHRDSGTDRGTDADAGKRAKPSASGRRGNPIEPGALGGRGSERGSGRAGTRRTERTGTGRPLAGGGRTVPASGCARATEREMAPAQRAGASFAVICAAVGPAVATSSHVEHASDGLGELPEPLWPGRSCLCLRRSSGARRTGSVRRERPAGNAGQS